MNTKLRRIKNGIMYKPIHRLNHNGYKHLKLNNTLSIVGRRNFDSPQVEQHR